MAPRREPTIQILVLSVFLFIIIVSLIVVYIFRGSLFGPADLSIYGTRGQPEVGPCQVENKSNSDVRCTDVGTQVSISKCIANPVTGYGCWDGSSQNFNSQVTVSSCIPTCVAFAFTQIDVTPCLLSSNYLPPPFNITVYPVSGVDWCRERSDGARFRIYKCERKDGSGLNLCSFTCGSGVDNEDCFTPPDYINANSGTTILYDPTLVPTQDYTDLQIQNGAYFYNPTHKSFYGFPVIPSALMTTRESCSDISGIICGTYEKAMIVDGKTVIDTKQDNSFTLTENCNIERKIAAASEIGYLGGNLQYNYDVNSNDIYDMFDSGIQERLLTCFDSNGVPTARCNPTPSGCITSDQIFINPTHDSQPNNIIRLLGSEQRKICGTTTKDSNGLITAVTKNASLIKPCIYVNPNFSLDPNDHLVPNVLRPSINTTDWLFQAGSSIFGTPLFMKKIDGTRDLYLTLFNTPCPDYNVSIPATGDTSRIFNFTANGSFTSPLADPIPFSGIPFSFDCKGNTNGVIAATPCSWIEDIKINPATIFGVEQACNTRNMNISPIIEQTALMLMIRPATLRVNEVIVPGTIKCNIFGIFGGNYIGWLAIRSDFPGYATSTSNVLSWVQGRFDSYGNSLILPGSRISDIINADFYLTKTTIPFAFTISNVNILDGINNAISPLGTISFQRATSEGSPLIETIGTTNIINDTTFSNFLYSRQNNGSDTRFPTCNIMISR